MDSDSEIDIVLGNLHIKEAKLRIKILANILKAQETIKAHATSCVSEREREAAKEIYKGVSIKL